MTEKTFRKIAIAGFGLEGRASYSYFKEQYPEAKFVIVDEKTPDNLPKNVELMSGLGVFERLSGFDMVVRTAGLVPYKIKTAGKVWSGTNEFFAKCPAPIIGVTGTKGKGTTCSLIVSILRQAGKNVHLVGNIGVPALEILPNIKPDDIVVYELSSFQLWDLERSPHIAVVLMIEADHLDMHPNMEDYVKAKSNIARFQENNDILVYHPTNSFSEKIAKLSASSKVKYSTATNGGVYVKANNFFIQNELVCKISDLKLVGKHNLDNACAAISAIKSLNFSVSNEAISEGLRSFTGLEHRLQLVMESGGIKYYDDSIATTPGSAVAAINSFTQPKILILGGKDKGGDYGGLAKIIYEDNSVKKVILIGENAAKIGDFLKAGGVPRKKVVNLGIKKEIMKVVVRESFKYSKPGDVVILSPSAASFDMFNDYKERGEKFIEALKILRYDKIERVKKEEEGSSGQQSAR